mgnify:CR=1 FL=1
MSKAYLLVICLFFASLSGCITDDEPEEKSPTEDDDTVDDQDTIEPVGQAEHNNTSSNDTYNYDNTENHYYFNNESYYFNETNYLELISAIEVLTDEVEKLRMEIEEMKSSGYDAPENSTIELKSTRTRNDGQGDGWYYVLEPWINITKNGNTVTVEYVGSDLPSTDDAYLNGTCTGNTGPMFTFANVDGAKIASYHGNDWIELGFEVTDECEWDPAEDGHDHLRYWTTVTFTFPEEPVRFCVDDLDYPCYTF